MWLVGVVSKKRVWLVGVSEIIKSMGVAIGCDCKEVYRFPHTTYPYSSCICHFCSSIPTQHPYFLFILLNVFRSCSSTFCNKI